MDIALLIIIGILLFELIIFFHEGGHFVCAKLSGVRVNEFALGMGPRIFKFTKGETTYSLRLFPIGGFCAMEGEDGESDDEHAFSNAKVWKRIIIVIAGAIMNILLGLVFMFIFVVQQPVYSSTTIDKFQESSVTQQAGLQVGDTFVAIDDYAIYNAKDISFALGTMKTTAPHVVVNRDGVKTDLGNIQFNTTTGSDGKEIVALDFYVKPIERSVGSVLSQTIDQTVSVVRIVWSSLIGLITGQYGMNDISGPVGAASAISQVAGAGLEHSFLDAFNNILFMMMVITVNLGIFNMLPIPALDGGRLVFLIIEAIRRKPVPQKYEGVVHGVGFALLMVFMVAVTFNDIWRLITGAGIGQ